MKIRDKINNLYINLFPNAIVDPKDIEFEALVNLVLRELLKRHNEEYLMDELILHVHD